MLLLSLTIGCLAACSPALPSTEPRGSGRALLWYPDGRRLLVDGRWELDVAREDLRRLPFDAAGRSILIASGGSGSLLLTSEGYELWRSDRRVASGPLMPLLEDDPSDRVARLATVTTGFWVDDRRVYVSASHPHREASCGMLDVESGSWSAPPGGCLQVTPFHIERTVRGPGDLVAVTSVAEGHPGFTVLRWSETHGPRELALAPVHTYPSAVAYLDFSITGDRVDLLTQCRLDRAPETPCDLGEEDVWYVYSHSLATGQPHWRRRRALHCGSPAWSAASETWACADAERVCLHDSSEASTCVRLPAEER